MTPEQQQHAVRPAAPSINGWSAEYLEAQYRQFKDDPNSVSADTRAFFQGFELGSSGPGGPGVGSPGDGSAFQARTDDLITAYRDLGHLCASIDPFGRVRPRPQSLSHAYFGLTDADLSRPVEARLGGEPRSRTLREVIAHLEATYCGSIGVEYTHMHSSEERNWFLEAFEGGRVHATLSPDDRLRILHQLTRAEVFEQWLGKRYQGAKRFSLEGGESLIPVLKFLTHRAGQLGVAEMVVGMAHRGRLTVLRNYLGKNTEKLITEFEDSWAEGTFKGSGDVKYHRGYSGDQPLGEGERRVHISMLNNPSHLESVNPVVLGRARARQDRMGDVERARVVPLLIHGDAAVSGQGVVAECLNMAYLDGYNVGGTVHVVVNNQVGFTTEPEDGRSTPYCTDVAKMLNCPVLHVNGNDPEACAAAARLAIEYRQQFKKDIWIDIVCYRRWGHNEQDEPAYTQPTLYAMIRKQPSPLQTYRQKLVSTGFIEEAKAQAIADEHFEALDKSQEIARKTPEKPVPEPGGGAWAGFTGQYSFESPKTSITPDTLRAVCEAMGRTPDGFNLHPKLKPLLSARAALPSTGKLCHADAEVLAFGSLLLDGAPIRLSGQDCRRGTFSQRHAVLRDEQTGEMYTPINNIRSGQALADVWDSPLSEYAVMGFDYGYSRGSPQTLVIWEAQFGDFVNGAQIMLDQYLASSEVKWDRWAGLVLMLPHGYEGQGPEHSSARLERFLQLCADDSMEVVYPSTAAQHFHLLRRQSLRKFRKPLIIMTPKKYLREFTSTVGELLEGGFRHVIDDPRFTAASAAEVKSVSSVVYCSGKFYHELNERRLANGRSDVAIIRIEQLYPLHADAVAAIDRRYPASATRIWAQEEPRNAGAYLYIADRFREEFKINLQYAGRPASASPAVGSLTVHKRQQEAIIASVVGPAAAAEPDGSRPKKSADAKAAKASTA